MLNILNKHNINIQNCRGQAYDEVSAMSSGKKSAQNYIKGIPPNTEYTCWRNHVLNLKIAHASKNSSLQ